MNASTGEFAIDTNVLLRFLLSDHAILSPRAKKIIDAVNNGTMTVFCDPIVFAEVVWVLKSAYKVPPPVIMAKLQPIVLADGFHMPNKEHYVRVLELYGTTVHHFGDACACAAALDLCDGRLLSFDKMLTGVEGIIRTVDID